MQRAKNEKLKKQIVDKMILFLNNKYNRMFKDKKITNEMLRKDIDKLIGNQNFKNFDYQTNIKKVEKSILSKASKIGKIKYQPVQMNKINDLLNFDKDKYLAEEIDKNNNNKNIIDNNIINRTEKNIKNNLDKNNEVQVNKEPIINKENNNIKVRPQSAVVSINNNQNKSNNFVLEKNINDFSINNNNNFSINNNNNFTICDNQNKNEKIMEYNNLSEKMRKLKLKEQDEWAIKAKLDHDNYIKEENEKKKLIYEKQMKQRQLLENQIKEKKEREEKYYNDKKNKLKEKYKNNYNSTNKELNNNIENEKKNQDNKLIIDNNINENIIQKNIQQNIIYQGQNPYFISNHENNQKMQIPFYTPYNIQYNPNQQYPIYDTNYLNMMKNQNNIMLNNNVEQSEVKQNNLNNSEKESNIKSNVLEQNQSPISYPVQELTNINQFSDYDFRKKSGGDLNQYYNEIRMRKQQIRDQYKQIEKENYLNAMKKKEEKKNEKEKEKKLKNELNEPEEISNLLLREKKLKQKNLVDQINFNKEINNNYNEDLAKFEKQKKMEDFRKILDEQVNQKKKMNQIKEMINNQEKKIEIYDMNQQFIEDMKNIQNRYEDRQEIFMMNNIIGNNNNFNDFD